MGRKQNEATKVVWRDRLARFDGSGTSVKQFCQKEGVSEAAFYQWRKRLKGDRRRRKATDEPSRTRANATEPFVPVTVATTPFAEVEFPNGVRVRVPATHADALRVVIRMGHEVCREVG